MNVGDRDILPKGQIPLVVSGVHDFRAYAELLRECSSSIDPQTRHKYDHMIAGIWGCEGRELPSGCLGRVVDLIGVVCQGCDLFRYIDLV